MRAVFQTAISVKAVMTISIKLKKAKVFKSQNYNFFLKNDCQFDLKKEFFVYVTDAEIKTIQIKNTSNRSFIIFKNFRIGHFRDYTKKKCFLATSKNNHLIISLSQKLDLKQIFKNLIMKNSKKFFMKTILSNKITVYENKKTMKKIIAITKKI